MANREKGEVSLSVGGTSYTLVLSINGMLEAEDAATKLAGKPMLFDDIGKKLAEGSIRYMRLVVWALLRKYHHEMDEANAGDLIDDAGGLIGISPYVMDAISIAAPDQKDKKALGADKARPRTARANGSGGTPTSPRAVSA